MSYANTNFNIKCTQTTEYSLTDFGSYESVQWFATSSTF